MDPSPHADLPYTIPLENTQIELNKDELISFISKEIQSSINDYMINYSRCSIKKSYEDDLVRFENELKLLQDENDLLKSEQTPRLPNLRDLVKTRPTYLNPN